MGVVIKTIKEQNRETNVRETAEDTLRFRIIVGVGPHEEGNFRADGLRRESEGVRKPPKAKVVRKHRHPPTSGVP